MIMGLGRTVGGGGSTFSLSGEDGAILFKVQTSGTTLNVNVNGVSYIDIDCNSNVVALNFAAACDNNSTVTLKNISGPIDWGTGPIFDNGASSLTLYNVTYADGTLVPPQNTSNLTLDGGEGPTTLDMTGVIVPTVNASGVTTLTAVNFDATGSVWTVNWDFSNNTIPTTFMDALYVQRAHFGASTFNLGTAPYDMTQGATGFISAVGTGYSVESNIPTSGGTGTGLLINVAQVSIPEGYVQDAEIAAGGTGYADGDIVTLLSGDGNATYTITTGNFKITKFSAVTGSTITHA